MSSINDIQSKRKNGLNKQNLNKKILLKINISKQNQKQIEIDNLDNLGDIIFEFCKKNDLNYQSLNQIMNTMKGINNNNKNNDCYEINLWNNSQNNINNKVKKILTKKINKIVKEEEDENIDSSQRNKRYIIPIKKSQKLFPYEFKIKKNFNSKNKELSQDSISFNNPSNQLSNRINISSQMNLNNLSSIDENQTGNTLKPMNTISNFSRISENNNFKKIQNNIFDRLFNDAQIKRAAYRRPCHFSSDLRDNSLNNNKINSSHILDNNSILFSNTNLTLLSNYSNINENNNNYNNSYLLRSLKTLSPECIFQPNSSLKRNKSLNDNNKKHINKRNKDKYENILKHLDYKPKIIKEEENENDKHIIFNTISGTNEKKKKLNMKNVNKYIPLKSRISCQINQNNLLLEEEVDEAFNNLFFELNGNNNSINELNEKNINIEKIPTHILYDIEPITSEIYKNKKTYSIKDFKNEMKEIIIKLPKDDTKNIINLYKNKNSLNNFYLNTEPNENKKKQKLDKKKENLNRTSRTMQISNRSIQYISQDEIKNNNKSFINESSRKKYKNPKSIHSRLPSGTEKKRNFFYL